MDLIRKKSALSVVMVSALLLAGCNDDDNDDESSGGQTPEVTREHDSRSFSVPPVETLAFEPMSAASTAYYGTYEGLQGEAAYAAEFPKSGWNGRLIMYTHGYGGEGETLGGQVPNAAWRAAVLAAGYAWAGSSYSANYYDVRAAIEDTNKLALELMDYLERDWSVGYDEPDQRLISGFSMGGHTAAAAVDRENIERARFQVQYAGALPFCQAEQNQFQWLGDYPRAAQQLAGLGDMPYEEFQSLLPQITENLFVATTGENAWVPANEAGERLRDIAMNLTGGERPIFEEYGFRNGTWQGAVLGTGGRAGTINGILARNIYDNTGREYRWTGGAITAEEQSFNEAIDRVERDPEVNPVREDGVRWLPLVQGDFDVPVMTLHTLGDFYVPFRHQQLYREAAIASDNENLLVQRAIRAPSHCDFSGAEITIAMTDFLGWVNGGSKPAGDDADILDPEKLAAEDFGCRFTDNTASVGRESLPACPSL
ncbi:alpha/beta hydrolase [Marinobacter fonticola]|uniref:alpha/beta hydrolase n=1 Tax=Marinobacter fonticola TaxID=2603215 RepID=UPI0011E62A2A|nr:alpha/beta hydrolase [Marinobacter fonticola]